MRNIVTKERIKDKSMLKHIARKYKVVSYVDQETLSGTQISSGRRSSRTAVVKLHSALERRNTNFEELNTADLTLHETSVGIENAVARKES